MNVVHHFFWLFYYAAPAKVTRDEMRRAANDVNNRHNSAELSKIEPHFKK